MRRPRVSVHFAQSLDGRIAVRGQRTLLSSAEGVRLAHQVRASHDAVLVGSGTVRIDNPRLTVRDVAGRSPQRVVLASQLDLPADARVLGPGVRAIVIGTVHADARARARLEAAGAEVRLVEAGGDGLVSLPHALCALAEFGIERLVVEGGGRVLTALLRTRLVDWLSVEVVPRWLGTRGLPAVGDLGIVGLSGAPWLEGAKVEPLGGGFVVSGRPTMRGDEQHATVGSRIAGVVP